MEFNRERFLYYLLSSILAWQAIIFTFGVYKCAQVSPLTQMQEVCPKLGERYETFVNSALGAVLGLIGGSAVASAAFASKKQKEEQKSSEDRFPKDRP